jgi:hypothetical protein
MAQPIRATPTLRGKDAEKFLRDMMKRQSEPLSEADKELYAEVKKNRKYFDAAFAAARKNS